MPSPFAIEPLEPRRHLSVTWVNRGKADNFDATYKTNAKVARQIVDAAIADWNAALPKVNVALQIAATDLAGKGLRLLGVTSRTSIRLDNDGAGKRWYFDPDLSDNSDFTDVLGPYAAANYRSARIDFYSVAAHEIGHALGYRNTADPARTTVDGRVVTDTHHSGNPMDLMTPFLSSGTRHLISVDDIRRTPAGAGLRVPIAPRSYLSAAAAPAGRVVILRWSDASPSKTYVYRSTRPGPDHVRAGATRVATVDDGRNTYFDRTAIPGRTYYYFVVPARDALGAEALATGRCDDTDPVALRASTNGGPVHLQWDPVPGAVRYEIRRGTADPGTSNAPGILSGTLIDIPADGTAATATWDDAYGVPGTTYYYRVVAIFEPNDGGYGPRLISPPVSATRPVPAITFQATGIGGGIDLTWDYVVGTRSVRIYRASTNAGSRETSDADLFIEFDDYIPPHVTDPNTTPGLTYYYWLEATFADGIGAWTDIPGTTVASAVRPEPSPDAIRASRQSDGSITVSFDGMDGVHGYVLYRSTANGGSLESSDAIRVTSFYWSPDLQFRDTGVTHGQEYFYWVVAISEKYGRAFYTYRVPGHAVAT